MTGTLPWRRVNTANDRGSPWEEVLVERFLMRGMVLFQRSPGELPKVLGRLLGSWLEIPSSVWLLLRGGTGGIARGGGGLGGCTLRGEA